MPLLLMNGLGSMLYHAFRSSGFFLLMDVLPAAILTVGVSIYFWTKVLNNIIIVAFIILSALVLRFVGYNFFTLSASTNLSYLISGIVLFIPSLLYLHRNNNYQSGQLVSSIFCLIIALIFRAIDKEGIIPLKMGTHFLWHLFSGIGGFFLANYLYHIRKREIELKN